MASCYKGGFTGAFYWKTTYSILSISDSTIWNGKYKLTAVKHS